MWSFSKVQFPTQWKFSSDQNQTLTNAPTFSPPAAAPLSLALTLASVLGSRLAESRGRRRFETLLLLKFPPPPPAPHFPTNTITRRDRRRVFPPGRSLRGTEREREGGILPDCPIIAPKPSIKVSCCHCCCWKFKLTRNSSADSEWLPKRWPFSRKTI